MQKNKKKISQKKYYAVQKGRDIGIFENWNECQKSISGFPGNKFKSFNTKKEAEEYLKEEKVMKVNEANQKENEKENSNNKNISNKKQKYDDVKEIGSSITVYTDGSCFGNGFKGFFFKRVNFVHRII